MRVLWIRRVGWLGALAAGCSGGDSGGGGTPKVESGLAGATQVSDLTASEQVTLCEAEEKAARAAISQRQFCTLMGVGEATVGAEGDTEPTMDRATCEAARDACMGEPFLDDTSCDAAGGAGCEVTVAEYERCVSAQIARMASILNSVSCSRAPTRAQIDEWDPDALPPECAGLDARCPDSFGSGGSTGTTSNLEPSPSGCDDTCVFAEDGECDDTGPGGFGACGLGTDCTDCGPREPG